ncbi:polyketide synthase, putative [Talaromyces stipitatus ATCC 10500]|uniref:Polyketide synthase, putative n=1 Tax=Talaromyces stipitatus (strain ATCC 10500 / CBS 375.48 / QM 6759 / NRRL 1006) TaxID=441959 RepID=B8MF01_TALSN|nr:polyketide synthase, putative [Talaromyces stipitatus ATCC 10500]EED15770.1 polyketide synthase, putative [Talaromyces stipitatus ATCC 10500]
MSSIYQLYVFGDLNNDFDSSLRALCKSQGNPLLVSFLDRAAFALRAEIGALPLAQRSVFPSFTTLPELLAKLQSDSVPHPALETALVCVLQFASFIKYISQAGQLYPTNANERLTGLCTGLLTAVTVSCCRSLSELIPLAVHTVIIALHTGFLVNAVRLRIELSGNASDSWSMVIPGLKEDPAIAVLEKFSSEMGIPVASRPYISASSHSGVTLSGPPQTLSHLLASDYLPTRTSLQTRIRGPYHAPHLYDETDVEDILQTVSNGSWGTLCNHITVQTSCACNAAGEANFASLMRVALREILLEPLRIDMLSNGVASEIAATGTAKCTLLPVGTLASSAFITALKNAGTSKVDVDNSMKGLSIPEISIASDSGVFGQSKLAIVGYSGRFPDANSNNAFWELLCEGRDVARVTPKQRWNVATHVDPTLKKKNTSGTLYGCWLKDPGHFDARFFGMSPREAPQVDPAQRLSLMTVYEAMENAGMVPDATPSTRRDRVGVFVGSISNDWGETNSSQDIDTYYIPGSCRAFIPGRQNYYYKFSGPSYSIDTACSSSLAAMHVACNAIWRGDIDTAICGGTNVMSNPDITAGLDRGYFLSRTGNCKTFDDDADGYCRGEGVVSMVVKRLEDAIADNDPICALILNAYTNHSAEAESITRPHVGAQKAIFERVLTSSAVDPSAVSYIEMHGTGTQAGDAREMESVLSTFANKTTPGEGRETPIHLGSVKANVGHGESVSGIIALTKILMMMEKNEIPPHCGIKTKINHKFPQNLAERKVFIADKPTPWPRPEGQSRLAMVNNFSAAGGNSCVLVEDAPRSTKKVPEDLRSTHIVAVSAKTKTALLANIKSLVSYIEKEAPFLPSLSYTTTARRVHHPHRATAIGNNLDDILAQFKTTLSASAEPVRPKATSVVFAFTGQGSQYPGMAHELLQFKSFRADIEHFDRIAQRQGFPSFLPVIMATTGEISDFSPIVVQLAATCSQMALAKLWRSWGAEPVAVVGHSLGEYAALNVAGILSDVDTIYLVGKRAELLQTKCVQGTHGMIAVSASLEEIAAHVAGNQIEFACINAPTEIVLSGTTIAIDEAVEALSQAEIKKMTRLRVPYAFHSSQIDTIMDEFEAAATTVRFEKPQVPLMSPLLSQVIDTAGIVDAKYLARHARDTVNLCGALQAAKAMKLVSNASSFIEVGPHPVIVGLLKSNLGPVMVLPTLQRKMDAWRVLTRSLSTLYESGYTIQWGEYHHDFQQSLGVLRLPNYNWDLENYWIQYENDWSLFKGDAAFLTGAKPALSTTCVHRIVEEKHGIHEIVVVGESNLLREDLDSFVRGHKINGVALCTPSVYAEMALVLGDYIRKSEPKWANCLVDVQHMDVQKPLAVKTVVGEPQPLRCRVAFDTATSKAAVQFYSVTPEGKTLTKHAECSVSFPVATEALAETQKSAGDILTRMISLRRSIADNDRVQKMAGSTGYQLVSSLASYAPEYKGVTEVVIDSNTFEAVAKIKCNKAPTTGVYKVNPYLIDNFGQPALFIMNANDQVDLDKDVFVNHGWTSLHFYKEVSLQNVYHSYVKMTGPNEEGMYSGDMTIFDLEGGEVVACYRGIKAQKVPRRLMDYIVRMRDDTRVEPPVSTNKSGPAGIEAHITEPLVIIAERNTSSVNTSSWPAALKIISEESGVPVTQLTKEKTFADLGVDSLLSLLCASRFREELSLHCESMIFEQYPTVGELQAEWETGSSLADPSAVTGRDAILNSMFYDEGVQDDVFTAKKSSEKGSGYSSQTDPTGKSSPATEIVSLDLNPSTKVSSLLIQGNPTSPVTTKTLFLLPDGSGSASSYGSLPTVDKSVAVVALNCPYMKEPSSYPLGIDHVADLYITEIQRRQPHGPYVLGGWSVGGIFAYHCAQLLAAQGEVVSDLFLLDCPVPQGLDHLPRRYFEYCDEIGLLGVVHSRHGERRAPPPWLIPHFTACINSLHDYYASPFVPASRAPKTHVIWACNSIDADIEQKFEHRDDDPKGLKFLTTARKDFGPCGWETLLPVARMSFSRVEGANHFTMMKGPGAEALSRIIKNALV